MRRAGPCAAVAGGIEYQIDQGVAAARVHASRVAGTSSPSGTLVEHREHPEDLGCWQVGGQGGHPIGRRPHLHPTLTPSPLRLFLGGGGAGRQHRLASRGAQLPRGLLSRLDQHLLLDRRSVLVCSSERLIVSAARMRALAMVMRPCSSAASVPGNRVLRDHASPTRPAAVRAETLSIRPTSATADSWAGESYAPHARFRTFALRERGHLPNLPGLRPGDDPFPTPQCAPAPRTRDVPGRSRRVVPADRPACHPEGTQTNAPAPRGRGDPRPRSR